VGETSEGIRWGSFAQEAADLAGDVRALIEASRFAMVGTIRQDGTPRISAVETHLVDDDLMLVMIPRTRKAADVRRDNRILLQSPIANAANPGAEFKLRGRALVVKDHAQRMAAAEVIESYSGWRPEPSWLFLSVMTADVTHIVWRPDGTATLSRWTVASGSYNKVRLRLDRGAGRYKSDQ
jgi:predicted pyridoxine 5'-phosphate oxidase superfamily flavin-nucleotide-binding protein